jgi:L-lactate dehydrogenase complex protein LldF
MTVHTTSPQFKQNSRRALDDAQLQGALAHVKRGFIEKRQAAADKLPEFEALRDAARDIKDHTLQHLDLYLEAYEERVRRPAATSIIAGPPRRRATSRSSICRAAGARTVAKGKSMIAEEIGSTPISRPHGIEPIETISARYIIQLRARRRPHHRAAAALSTRAGGARFPPRPYAISTRTRPVRAGEPA